MGVFVVEAVRRGVMFGETLYDHDDGGRMGKEREDRKIKERMRFSYRSSVYTE